MAPSMPTVSVANIRNELPIFLEPQLCTPVEQSPTGADWLHELKYDGWRLLARKCGDDMRLYTRGGIEWSQRLPRLVEAVRNLRVDSAWLDGETVHLDDAGFPDFEQLQRDIRARVERRLVFHVFDVPWLNSEDLTRRPLFKRKERLRDAISGADPRIRFTDYVNLLEIAGFRDHQVQESDSVSRAPPRSLPRSSRRTSRRKKREIQLPGAGWRGSCSIIFGFGAFLLSDQRQIARASARCRDSWSTMTVSWQANTLVQCISVRPWLTYPGCDEPGGCHDLTLGKIYEMLGVEGKGSFYRIVDDSGGDFLYPVSHFRVI